MPSSDETSSASLSGAEFAASDPLPVEVALRWGSDRLSGVADRPRLEAERLLAAVLQVERPALMAHPELTLRPAQARVYADAVHRRQHGAPLPYLLGRVEFFGLELIVTPDVLIPRPETELLVERALDDLKERMAVDAAPMVVDVGTGSGCIAIALAVTLPALHITAIDIERSALAVARANGLRHGVEKRISWVRADLLAPIAGPIDVLVSNPPYVAEREWEDLPVSVRQEPRRALLAGPEGLAAIRPLLDQARSRLAPDGLMLVEIGSKQGDAVRALAQTAFPGADVTVHADSAGLDRILAVRRPARL